MNIDFKIVIPKAQAGDKAARDTLMAAFYAKTVTIAKSVVRDSEAAKDVALGFWEWLYAEDGIAQVREAFYPWMEKVVRSRALAAAQKRQPKVMYYSEVQDPDSWSSDPADKVGAVQDLQVIAAKLNQAQQDVFWLLLEGETPAEIAEQCEITERHARRLIDQVREVITDQIGG